MEPQYNTVPQKRFGGHGAEIAAVFFASVICALVAYAFGLGHNLQLKKQATLSTVQKPNQSLEIDPFATITLQAHAAYVFDVVNQKVIFAKNANDILPLASITKIMTADVASESLSKNAVVSIDQLALAKDGDSGLLNGEKWNFTKLLDYTLAVSSNDGAAALAEAVGSNFVDKMNQKASSLSLPSMHFYNETGLDESQIQSGGYSSAADLAKLFEYTLKAHPDIFVATTYPKFSVSSLDKITHVAINTDEDIDKIPGIIGSKTGFTDLAGGNLAIVYDASLNYPVIAIVLGSTYDGRFTDMSALINATNQKLSLQK